MHARPAGVLMLGILTAIVACDSGLPSRTSVKKASSVAALATPTATIMEHVVSVAAGGNTTCAILETGHAWCWGSLYTQPSVNGRFPHPIPTLVDSSRHWSSLGVTSVEFCGTDERGVLYCGGASDRARVDSAADSIISMPPIAPVDGVPALSAFDITCGIAKAGPLYCWGRNSTGELGRNTVTVSEGPDTVYGGHRFAKVSTGFGTTCAVEAGGQVFCWGKDDYGNLGRRHGHITCRNPREGEEADIGPPEFDCSPTPVPIEFSGRIVDVAVAWMQSCGVTDTKALRCWGGQWVESGGGGGSWSPLVRSIDVPGVQFMSVTAGYRHFCALATDGRAFCWGEGLSGKLGDGIHASHDGKVPAAVKTDIRFVSLSAGEEHTCGLTRDGRVYCWGENSEGELGTGTTDGSSVPTPVMMRTDKSTAPKS